MSLESTRVQKGDVGGEPRPRRLGEATCGPGIMRGGAAGQSRRQGRPAERGWPSFISGPLDINSGRPPPSGQARLGTTTPGATSAAAAGGTLPMKRRALPQTVALLQGVPRRQGRGHRRVLGDVQALATKTKYPWGAEDSLRVMQAGVTCSLGGRQGDTEAQLLRAARAPRPRLGPALPSRLPRPVRRLAPPRPLLRPQFISLTPLGRFGHAPATPARPYFSRRVPLPPYRPSGYLRSPPEDHAPPSVPPISGAALTPCPCPAPARHTPFPSPIAENQLYHHRHHRRHNHPLTTTTTTTTTATHPLIHHHHYNYHQHNDSFTTTHSPIHNYHHHHHHHDHRVLKAP
ncbi:hypothetical protein O3P69_015301 [Scylla paramamosain]|uniref:Uncharacterized protein n=1 Tax=Scylla paramamosain TaxID=85552 RepID=A0AAW0T4Y8_SCYPA